MPMVLVVDDSPADQRLIGEILARTPEMQIEYASDMSEALARIETLVPHLVISDLVLPERVGLQLLAEVKCRFPQVPVILVTDCGTEQTAVEALQAGAASYVPKSSVNELLVETVDLVLAANQQQRLLKQLMNRVQDSQISFELENDSTLIPTVISYVQTLAAQVGLLDESDNIRVAIALEEALRNAMFHGNLEISSACREGDLCTYETTLKHRLENEPYRSRRLHLELRISPEIGEFTIRDEGPGFDPQTLPDPTAPENLERNCGRGLLLMRTFMDDVQYNATGNQVKLFKRASRLSLSVAET